VKRRRARASAPALSADARTRILDAALAEFVARGFEAASTNTIAREAGVAKGLVFHHFGSKADLYLAVHEHVAARVGAQVLEVPRGPVDLFEWLRAIAIRKVQVLQRDPAAYQFVLMARDAPAPLRAELERRMAALRAEAWRGVLGAIDASRLRPGVTLEQALETLTILGEGLDRRYMPRIAALPDRGFSQLEALTAEVWSHYLRLRDGLYAPAPPRAQAPARRAHKPRAHKPRAAPKPRARKRA
jgi:TetR/AcrR family transcriptional regulator